LLRAWGRGLRPDADLTVSEWADAHRMLGSRASAEPGRYRTARTPYMREIMDALSPSSAVQRIVFMKAAQVGATEAGNNWIGFAIHHAPGPMLAVQPTVELAKRNSRQRIDPLIEESPELRDRVKPARSRDAGNTMLSKEFAGGILIMTGANSAVGLRSTPARYIFLDEVDAYPASADDEGDPVSLAEARTVTFCPPAQGGRVPPQSQCHGLAGKGFGLPVQKRQSGVGRLVTRALRLAGIAGAKGSIRVPSAVSGHVAPC